MTYEELMKKIDYLHDLHDYDRDPYYLGNRVRYWAELKKHFDKYRWHDLRKNPEDLPKADTDILVAYEYPKGQVEFTVIVRDCWFWKEYDILKWKYIDPF